MGQLVQVKLGEYRSVIWVDANNVAVHRHDMVVLEVERNLEFGKVISNPDKVPTGKTEAAGGKIIRLASDGDLRQVVNNEIKSVEALKTCKNKVIESKMDMQLVQVEYSFDATKILIFFTAEGRVDFRSLVKDLAKMLRVRIELKQIGVRDKAKIVGGYGVCGRELCCSSYMKDFHPLSIKMAEETIGTRMDFDTEIMVRLFWRGVPPVMVPVRVIYPEGNSSNFRMLADNLRISAMHTRLVLTMLFRLPSILRHRPGSGASAHWAGLGERGALWGLAFVAACYRLLGRRVCGWVMAPIVLYFFLSGGAEMVNRNCKQKNMDHKSKAFST